MRDPDRFLGIAGPASEQERASLRQAVFLLRYRARLLQSMPTPALPSPGAPL